MYGKELYKGKVIDYVGGDSRGIRNTRLNNIEKGMAAMEKKIAASQSGLPSNVPPRQMPLYLNLAK